MKNQAATHVPLSRPWTDEEEFLRSLTPKARRHQRGYVFPWNSAYTVEVLGPSTRRPSEAEWAHFYQLYRNVQSHSLALNTFPLPDSVFRNMLDFPDWELIVLSIRPEFCGREDAPAAAMIACFVGAEQYVPLVMGMDYSYVRSHGLYRQCLRHIIERSRVLELPRILFGFGASLEKRRFGAKPMQTCLYFSAHDTRPFQILGELEAEAGG